MKKRTESPGLSSSLNSLLALLPIENYLLDRAKPTGKHLTVSLLKPQYSVFEHMLSRTKGKTGFQAPKT